MRWKMLEPGTITGTGQPAQDERNVSALWEGELAALAASDENPQGLDESGEDVG
jgi:hypothetical protein